MPYLFFFYGFGDHRDLHVLTHSFPTRRSSDLSGVLIDHGHQGAQGLIADIADIGIVQHYAAAHDVIVARQQIDDRTFSGARRPDQSYALWNRCFKRDVLKVDSVAAIAERHVVERNPRQRAFESRVYGGGPRRFVRLSQHGVNALPAADPLNGDRKSTR